MNFDFIEGLTEENIEEMYFEYNFGEDYIKIAECLCADGNGCYSQTSTSVCKMQDGTCTASYCTYLCNTKCNSSSTKCDNSSYVGFSTGWGCRLSRNGSNVWI